MTQNLKSSSFNSTETLTKPYRHSQIVYWQPRGEEKHEELKGLGGYLEVVMKDVRPMTPPVAGQTLGGPIREASGPTDVEDNNLIYDRECFKKNKA
jgi:hypothetical protein